MSDDDLPKVGERGVWVSEPMTVVHVSDNVGRPYFVDFEYDDGEGARVWFPRGRLLPVGANGYVVVPRHLLDELLATAYAVRIFTEHSGLTDDLEDAERAVVEAVGPTT